MISFAFLTSSLALATLIPAFAALYLVPALKVRPRHLASVGIGLAFWYFYDAMGDAASLGENNSIYPPYLFGGTAHLALIGAFVAGLAVIVVFDHYSVQRPSSVSARRATYLIPACVALVMGVHGLGEGWGAASAVSSAPFVGSELQSLIQAFGTFPALVSYPIHKFLEASVVAALYAVYLKVQGKGAWWEVPLLGVLFAGPSILGASAGYFLPFDTTYFFAFGATAALYAVLRLAEPLVRPSDSSAPPARYGPAVIALFGLGMLLLYAAALLH